MTGSTARSTCCSIWRARQKVDLARISVVALVEQYLAVIEGARTVRLEVAADWLVMAAWLTWLKSRLLLPPGTEAAAEAEEAAETLAARLAELQTMRAASLWLGARPQLGQAVFARGAPEDHTDIDRSRLALDVPGLLRAYLAAARRAAGSRRYRPRPLTVWTVKDALARLGAMLGSVPDWASLFAFPAGAPGRPARAAGGAGEHAAGGAGDGAQRRAAAAPGPAPSGRSCCAAPLRRRNRRERRSGPRPGGA